MGSVSCPTGLAFGVMTLESKAVKLVGFAGPRIPSRTLVSRILHVL